MAKQITDANLQEVLDNEELVVIDFWAEWCGPCRMLGPVLEEVSEDLPELTIVKVNVDEFPNLARRFNVSAIPTMVEFVENKNVNTLRGFLPKEALKTWIKQHE